MTMRLRRRRDPPRSTTTRGVLDLPLRLRESVQVLANPACRIHERGERREVARARMQTQQVETDALERGDALREMLLRRIAPRSQYVSVRPRRGHGGDHVQLRARFGRTRLERPDDRGQLIQLLPVRTRQCLEELGSSDA